MKNIFSNIPGLLQGELLERLVDENSFSIERIVRQGESAVTGKWFNRERHEWMMLVQGFVVLELEDNTNVEIKAGDYLLLEAGKKHRIVWSNPTDETIWLSVRF